MFLSAPQVDGDILFLGTLLYGIALLLALRRFPWRSLFAGQWLNRFFAACAFLVILWSLRAGVSPGLSLHYLGITTFVLVFGRAAAGVGGSLVLIVLGALTGMDWLAFGINALLLVVVPAWASYGIYRWVDRRLPKNFFIYVYACAFLGGAVSILGSVLPVAALLAVSGTYTLAKLGYEYLAYLPLLVLPEAMINGMVTTVLIALRPGWVVTYDEASYLGRGSS